MTTQSGDNVHVYGNPLSDGQDVIDPTEPALDGLPEHSSFEEDTASSKITGAPGRALTLSICMLSRPANCAGQTISAFSRDCCLFTFACFLLLWCSPAGRRAQRVHGRVRDRAGRTR